MNINSCHGETTRRPGRKQQSETGEKREGRADSVQQRFDGIHHNHAATRTCFTNSNTSMRTCALTPRARRNAITFFLPNRVFATSMSACPNWWRVRPRLPCDVWRAWIKSNCRLKARVRVSPGTADTNFTSVALSTPTPSVLMSRPGASMRGANSILPLADMNSHRHWMNI